MVSTVHVQRGIEFKKDIYAKDQNAWIDAVGKELESKGVTVRVGEGASAVDCSTAAQLKTAVADLQKTTGASRADVLKYVTDLLGALDDIVKPSSSIAPSAKFDLTKTSDLSKALGLNDSKLYASSTTTFGVQSRARPDGSFSVAGVRLQRTAATPPPPPPTPTPTTSLPESLIAGKNVIDAISVATPSSSWGRNSMEVEAVRTVGGLDKDTLHALVTQTGTSGRSVLQKLQKPTASLAFAVGYQGISLDQLKWDSDSHRLRMLNPLVSVTVEDGRIETDPKTNAREVTVGRDQFVDFVQEEFDLKTGKPTGDMLDNHVMVRGRARMDGTAGDATRVLIQSKIDTAIDPEFGVKFAQKQDERVDGTPVAASVVDNLQKNVQTGKGLNGSGTATATIEAFHALEERGALPEVDNHGAVLHMGTIAVNRAVRGRYHLNETPTSAVRDHFQQCGEVKLQELVALLNASPMQKAEKDALLKDANALLDHSAVVAGAAAGLRKLDPQMTIDKASVDKLWPDAPMTNNKLDVKKGEVVAKAYSAAYAAFAEKIDQAQQKIGGNEAREVRKAGGIDDLRTFFRAQTANAFGSDTLKQVETVGPLLAQFDTQLAGTGKAAFVDALGKSMAAAGNTRLQDAATPADKDQVLGDMRKNLVAGHAEILHRMLEESGNTAQTLWFDSVRNAYAGVQRSGWSNFIIDSFDMTEMYTTDEFAKLPKSQWGSRTPLDPKNMLDFKLSNDFQIELGYEKPYTDAIDRAKAALLAPLFIDFAVAKGGAAVDVTKRATLTDYLKQGMPVPQPNDSDAVKSARTDFLKEVQAFVKSKLPDLVIADTDLVGLYRNADAKPVDSFSGATSFAQLKPDVVVQLKDDLDTTKFIWRTLLKTQESVAEFRGERVMDLIGEAAKKANVGARATWKAPSMSKGEMAAALALGRTV